MDTTSPAPVAAEQEGPVVRTSSRSGLADSALGTRNLMTIAALAVVSMILLVPLNYVAPGAGAAPNGVLIGCSMMGLWVIPFLLPATVVRRPGAVVIGALLMGIMSVFTTPTGPAALLGTVIGGLFIEVPLALLLYRKWTWWSFLISAAVFGLLNGWMYLSLLEATVGASFTGAVIVVSLVSALAGGGIAIVLTRLLNRAGVGIDRRTSGRA
ncbi:ECF transporter S component [Actinomyces viscosus]|uniref:ECF transporter S component n=1 Tax=Actinomyces viscosus TaxID=1656 RepID=UPI0028EDD728|nr:ECF transporter S component [Actinomyces viscosus]